MRLPYSTRPKAKGGWKKKIARSVVLSTLSDTDDPAHSPVPVHAPADEVISSSPTGIERLTQESSSSQPSAKRQKKQLWQLTHEEEDDMAEWLKSNPCLYNKKLEDYRKSDMKQRLLGGQGCRVSQCWCCLSARMAQVDQNSFWQVIEDTLWIWSPGDDRPRC